MGLKTGLEFEIEMITCTESKVIGGTAKTWVFYGKPGSNMCAQFNDEWQRAWRPKIGGWLVSVSDPTQPNRGVWWEYETPSKRVKDAKQRAAVLARTATKKR